MSVDARFCQRRGYPQSTIVRFHYESRPLLRWRQGLPIPCISTYHLSLHYLARFNAMDALQIQTMPVYPHCGGRVLPMPWTSTNPCSAMAALQIHTIPVSPYRTGARLYQCHAYPQIFLRSTIPVCPYGLVSSLPVLMDICRCRAYPHYPNFPL